jgi:hypothetical protein
MAKRNRRRWISTDWSDEQYANADKKHGPIVGYVMAQRD